MEVKYKKPVILGVFILIVIFIVVIGYQFAMAFTRKQNDAYHKSVTIRSNLHWYVIALNRYADDHDGYYPADLNELFYKQYVTSLPENPFTKEPVHNIAFGHFPFEGEITYIPVFNEGLVTDYYVLTYGQHDGFECKDIDGDGIGDYVWVYVYSGEIVYPEDQDPQLVSILRPEKINSLIE